MQEEDRTLAADIKASESAIDYHTIENRQQRKDMQGRRSQVAEQMKVLGPNAQKGYEAMTARQQSVESALQIAAHAEKWEWNEVEAKPERAARG